MLNLSKVYILIFKVALYQRIFTGLQFCDDEVSCMTKAAKGGFAFISWKVYQKDIIARNFVDKFGKDTVYQVKIQENSSPKSNLKNLKGKRSFQYTVKLGVGISDWKSFETKV